LNLCTRIVNRERSVIDIDMEIPDCQNQILVLYLTEYLISPVPPNSFLIP
jgi:hypothetical protein